MENDEEFEMTPDMVKLICEYMCMCNYKMVSLNLGYRKLIRRRRREMRSRMMRYWFWYSTRVFYSDLIFKQKKFRKVWMHDRNSYDWWEREVPKFTDTEWLEHFRMTREVFNEICELLNPVLQAKPNALSTREPIHTEKKIAICLFFLSNYCGLRVIGEHFGVHKSTVCVLLRQFADAVISILMPRYVYMPNEEESASISKRFEELCGIPQIIGCIDSNHIHVSPPASGYGDFINTKGWPSIILQTIVDDEGRFRNVTCKNPGSMSDGAVLMDSNLYKQFHAVFPTEAKSINGIVIPYLIVANEEYPTLPWILKGYTGLSQNFSAWEQIFNDRLNLLNDTVDVAFTKLKSRWQRLFKCSDINISFVPRIIATCCTLHNLVESKNQPFNDSWMDRLEDANAGNPQPNSRQFPVDELDEGDIKKYVSIDDEEEVEIFPDKQPNMMENDHDLIKKCLTAYLAQNFEPVQIESDMWLNA